MDRFSTVAGLAAFVALAGPPAAAEMSQVSTHVGQMSSEMEMAPEMAPAEDASGENLRFEPWQMIDEMFFRDDVVFLMRHGPTDWSKLDVKDVAPNDCENQRVMSEQGMRDTRRLGMILASNDVMPGKIVVSQWCRNQQTLQNLMEGFETAAPGSTENIEVETSADLNLLLSLQGAPNVTGMRELISNWEGSENGPLMVISHFTNIEELTDFSVYEGENLVIDPRRDNRVIGYFRLQSAAPDVGHF